MILDTAKTKGYERQKGKKKCLKLFYSVVAFTEAENLQQVLNYENLFTFMYPCFIIGVIFLFITAKFNQPWKCSAWASHGFHSSSY